MAFSAYGEVVFENSVIVVYEFTTPDFVAEGNFVVQRTDPAVWHYYGDESGKKIATLVYAKACRLAADGTWPRTVDFHA